MSSDHSFPPPFLRSYCIARTAGSANNIFAAAMRSGGLVETAFGSVSRFCS